MVYKAYKPYEVEWKQVHNNRGKTVDSVTEELVKSYDYRPWMSTYGKDYNNTLGINQQSGNFSLPHLKPDAQETFSASKGQVKKTSSADGKKKPTATSDDIRAAFKAAPEPVYLQGDEEFLKQNLVADHFPNETNPYELELNA